MSILNVNQIQPVGSGQTVTISAANITASSSTITANTFSGALSSSGVSTFSDTVNVGAGKSIRLYGASSGYSEIVAAAGSASTTFTLPANGGSASQYLQTDGSGGLSWATVSDTSNWTIDTTGTSLTGASVTVTGIPNTAIQIQIITRDMSLDSNAETDLRLGTSSGLQSSGYVTNGGYWGSGTNIATFTDKFGSNGLSSLTYLMNGVWNFWKMGGANNWFGHGQYILDPANTQIYHFQGFVELTGTLDRVGFLARSGNFDSGTVFVSYLEE